MPTSNRIGFLFSFLLGLGLGAALVAQRDPRVFQTFRRRFAGSPYFPLEAEASPPAPEKPEKRQAAPNENLDKPNNAPESCPGTGKEASGKVEGCAGCPNQGACASGQAPPENPVVKEIGGKLANIKKKILILSGKGGVGKSTVAAQVTWELQRRNFDVGLLDVDVCGPSIPRMMGVADHTVHTSASGWSPVYVEDNLAVMSIGFLLPEEDDPIIWRGPKKSGLIKQFFTDVNWGPLDFLLIDTPPGTSDEHLSLVTYLKDAGVDGAIIVTTPQEVALADVRKEINFCRKTKIPVLGVVENMTNSVFAPSTGGAKVMCEKMDVHLIGGIPLNGDLTAAGDFGSAIPAGSDVSAALKDIADHLLDTVGMPLRRVDEAEAAGTNENSVTEEKDA